VKVRNGEAFLSGRIKNIDHHAAVFSDAYTAGVSRVDMSGLTIEQRPPEGFPPEMMAFNPELLSPTAYSYPSVGGTHGWSDETIQEAVGAAILHDPRLTSYMILVAVDHGKVTLTGEVDNLMAKRLASDETSQIQGVQKIFNRLLVHPNGKPADREIADNARAAFQRDPILAHGKVQVAVQDGQAVLSGTADSDFEKDHAQELVSRLNGIVSVKDDIKLNPRS
jgi:osmotically-inducible protein OsmY